MGTASCSGWIFIGLGKPCEHARQRVGDVGRHAGRMRIAVKVFVACVRFSLFLLHQINKANMRSDFQRNENKKTRTVNLPLMTH